MIFHRARLKNTDHRNTDVIMDHSSLTKIVSPKYLGVIVDHKLNWIDHITYIKNKISKGIGIMYKARTYFNNFSLKNLYYAYTCTYPHFTYCIEVWGSAAQCHVNSLFLLEKKITRIMTFSPYFAHTAPIFIDLAILPFNKIFTDRIGITMFKVEYELLPISVTQMFTKNKDIHSHNTRNRNILWMSTGTKNFSYHSAKIWNTIASKFSINVSLSQ